MYSGSNYAMQFRTRLWLAIFVELKLLTSCTKGKRLCKFVASNEKGRVSEKSLLELASVNKYPIY